MTDTAQKPEWQPRGYKGTKYEQTKQLDIAEVAKLVRADLKEAADKFPENTKFSVTISRYSMGQSLDVRIQLPAGTSVLDRERCFRDFANLPVDGHIWMSDSVDAWVKAVEEIVNAYNYDDSDSQSDSFHYRFAEHVTVANPTDVERVALRGEWDESRHTHPDLNPETRVDALMGRLLPTQLCKGKDPRAELPAHPGEPKTEAMIEGAKVIGLRVVQTPAPVPEAEPMGLLLNPNDVQALVEGTKSALELVKLRRQAWGMGQRVAVLPEQSAKAVEGLLEIILKIVTDAKGGAA